MKNFVIMNLFSFVFLLFFLFACSDEEVPNLETDRKEALQNLSGTYMDKTPYAYGNAFGQRIFTFDKGTWTLRFTLALDPNLEQQVFEFRTFGTYEVLNEFTEVTDAFNALFLEEKKFLTLKTDNPQLIEAFGFSTCNLVKDIEKDISESGCALWAAVEECNQDHDLLSLDKDGLLYFGVRPADNNMCTADRRPDGNIRSTLCIG